MKKIFILLSLLVSTNCFAQLTGGVRTNFINSTLQACYNNQRSSKVNAKITDQVIYDYCKCIATYTANIYKNQMVSDIESGRREMSGISEVANLAGNYCAKKQMK